MMFVAFAVTFVLALAIMLGAGQALGAHEEDRETEVRVRDEGRPSVRCDVPPTEPAVQGVPSVLEGTPAAGQTDAMK